MPAKPNEFLALIKQAGILNPVQLSDLEGRMARGDYPGDGRRFAEALVRDDLLTPYQMEELFAGRGKELRFDRYVIMDLIGQGAMGEVFKARHRIMGRVVALKTILPEIASKPRAIMRFDREIRMVSRLDHPNVVRAYDAEANDEHLFLVMEYVPGITLHDYIKEKGPFRPPRAVDLTIQAARGLHHAHLQGAIHRDVKPSNLLINERKEIKILDFGLGVLVDDPGNITRPDQTVGTVDFMSPEQAMGQEVTGRSDQFSLGCTLYYLLTGKFAFPGDNKIARLSKRLSQSPHPIRELRSDVPDPVIHIMERMMATEPEKRYPDLDIVANELAKLIKRPGRGPDLSSVNAPPTSVTPSAKPQVLIPVASSSGIAPSPSAVDVAVFSPRPADERVVETNARAARLNADPSLPSSSSAGESLEFIGPVLPVWLRAFNRLAATSRIGALLLIMTVIAMVFAVGILLGKFLWAQL